MSYGEQERKVPGPINLVYALIAVVVLSLFFYADLDKLFDLVFAPHSAQPTFVYHEISPSPYRDDADANGVSHD